MEIRKLNMLRGIAALIVVISHYSNSTNLFNTMLGGGAGQFGVMIFFILSGFLMSYLYMDKKFKHAEIKRFITARVARVVPLYLIIVLCSYLFHLMEIRGFLYKIPNEVSLLSHITLLSGTSILWTIPAEIQFYAFFLILWWLFAVKEGYLYILLAVLFLILFFLNFPVLRGNILGTPFIIRLTLCSPYFFIGVVFGQLYDKWKPPEYLLSAIFACSLLCIPLLYPKIFFSLVGHNHGMWRDTGVLASVSLVFFFIVFLVPDKNIIFSNCIGDFIGKISYSLYLLHIPVLRLLKETAKQQPEIFLVIFILASLAVSYVSYLLIEKPLRTKIRSLSHKALVAGI